MLKGIEEKIKATTIEALDLAFRMQSVSNEGFAILSSVTKKLNNATVEIHSVRRPFPLAKFALVHRAIRGHWEKAATSRNFTKITQVRQSGRVRLIINLYMRECLNPEGWDKVEVVKGNRGRVLTPEMCNGAEITLMKALDLQEKGSG